MPTKYFVYIAISLDGFIARSNGDLDWLPQPGTSTEDYGYAKFMASIDTLVMGRNTFEKVLTFGEWPYSGKRVIILGTTLTPESIPNELRNVVELHSGPVLELIALLEASGAKGVCVDGGKTIQSFIKAGKINEITITSIPVLIGSGLSLFGEIEQDINLKHIATQAYDTGLVQSTYIVNP